MPKRRMNSKSGWFGDSAGHRAAALKRKGVPSLAGQPYGKSIRVLHRKFTEAAMPKTLEFTKVRAGRYKANSEQGAYEIFHTHVTRGARLRSKTSGTTWSVYGRGKPIQMIYSLGRAKDIANEHYSERRKRVAQRAERNLNRVVGKRLKR